MTQERLAEVAELDRKHIGIIEKGEAEPRTGTLIRIAGALDIPIEALVTGLVFVPSEHSAGRMEVRGT
jgi:transcriptional regulator with XRE-family HTH domain